MGGGAVVPAWDSVASTFIASLRSVGTAVTLAGVGLYLHHIGAIGPEGKRTLALLSQQVTFPLFLFTKTIYCNQDWSEKPCPDVTRSLADVWMLMWWPAYVVAVGLAIGWLVAKLCNTPRHQKRSVLAACGFGNSTGLPITLLNVIHTNFPVDSDLGRMDPTLFLSVFLLLYPVLQWGLGGWILAPDIEQGDDERERSEKIATVAVSDEEDDFNNTNPRGTTTTNGIMDTHHHHQRLHPPASSMLHNVLNNTAQKSYFQQHRHGLTSADESFYVTEVNLTKLWQDAEEQERDQAVLNTYTPPRSGAGSRDSSGYGATAQDSIHGSIENEPLLRLLSRSSLYQQPHQQPPIVSSREFDTESLWQTIRNILDRCFQPPVMGAIAGILVAITPGARGIFVDLVDRNSSAPLQFFFDALYTVGETAVPINMMILGCNLSSSISKPTTALKSDEFPGNGRSNSEMLSMKSMIGIVIGKMIVMPMIGILSALILKTYVLDIPADIDGAFYLVLMILFLTPTANNLIIMVELSGSGAKEGMARVIALQYLVAPVILSLTMTIAIGVASGWSS